LRFTQATAIEEDEFLKETEEKELLMEEEETELLVEDEELMLIELEVLEELTEEGLAEHEALVIALVSSVTAPTRASALPFSEAPVVSEMDWSAITVPAKAEFVPKVADVPTCQKTLQACAPPISTTLRPDVVVRVEAI
jgi:hypothetical protein